MKSIIKWGLWQRRWFILWWCIGIAAFIFINLIFYPSFKDQAAELEKSFSSIPDSAMALFSDTGDFFSPEGYLSSQIFYLMMPLLLGIMSITLGSSLIAREEKEGTIELLLSRPVSRTKLLIGKVISGLIIIGVVSSVGLAIVLIMSKAVEIPVATINIGLTMFASIMVALSFGAIAFAITMFGKARVASVGLSTLIALGGYIIVSLAGGATWLKWPSKVFPFYYYHPAEILKDTYNWQNMLYVIGVIAACVLVSWFAFRRRDIG